MTESLNHIERISLFFRTAGAPILLLLAAATVAASFWYYRHTVPPVSGWTKRTVVGLRILALTALIIGLFEPVAHLVTAFTRQDLTAVLVDTSSSLDIPEDPRRKQDALRAFEHARSYLRTRGAFFGFDSDIHPLDTGVPSFTGAATDISTAVHATQNLEGVTSVILISDGCWNLGEDPVGSGMLTSVPVNTVQVGSDSGITEVILTSVSASPIGYADSSLTVEIVTTSSVESMEPVPVEVRENNLPIASGSVSFRDGTQAHITLDIPLDTPGYHRYTAVIHPPEDSRTENNTRSFGVTVLKSSFRILVVAAAPSSDLAFIGRAIRSDSAFDLDVVVDTGTKPVLDSAFPDGEFDAVILLDGGGDALSPQRAEALSRRISGGGGLWIIGSSFTGAGADELQGMLPVTFPENAAPEEEEFFIAPTESGHAHFITSGIDDPDSESRWDMLPPLRSILPAASVSQSGRILARSSGKSPEVDTLPAIVTGKYGSGKILVMPVSGIWRWKLMMEGAAKGGTFFNSFVLGTLRWLTSDIETSPLAITTGSKSYLSGQRIDFEGRLFDKVYMPVSGADISLVIDNDPAHKVFLDETAPGVYTGQSTGMEAGSHQFTAVAYVGNTRFAESSGSFLVERFSLEMLNLEPDRNLLAALASRTGGICVTSAGIDSVLSSLTPHVTTERREKEYHLYLSPVIPALVIGMLALEWGIRKRRGMM